MTKPVAPWEIPAGTVFPTPAGPSTALPDMDFETYSEAGYQFDDGVQRWRPIKGATKAGLSAVGSVVYAQHPSTEVLSLAYNLKQPGNCKKKLWIPGCPPPLDLLQYIAAGGLIEAFNVAFEFYIWNWVCTRLFGWQPLQITQLRCAMAKARAFSLPGGLGNAAKVLDAEDQKLTEGKRLIKKFSCPRNPSKNNPSLRLLPTEDNINGPLIFDYNLQDIATESAVSAACPDIRGEELEFWKYTMEMNARGVGVDVESARACISIIEQAHAKYNAELQTITGGFVSAASENQKLRGWLAGRGVATASLDEAHREKLLARTDLAPDVRRAIEIADLIGSAGVKKVYSMVNMAAHGDRLHELYVYHGARTGRDTGRDVQPTNLVKAGVPLKWCGDVDCGRPFGQHLSNCPHCFASDVFASKSGWKWEACDEVLATMRERRLEDVERIWGDALLSISGCIRGLFVPAPGKDFISTDYSAIEAVVTAMIAGEQWRIDAFRRNDPIYLVSASRITGTPLSEYLAYKAQHGEHHPDRQKIGKPAELGLGFGGWINAWRQFDKTDTFTDEQVKHLILDWRNASPAIVELWGGQVRGKPWAPDRYELYGLEGAAIAAVQNPGQAFETHGIGFIVRDDVLLMRIPSGRLLAYHRPRLEPSQRWDGQLSLSYEGWNSNPKMGAMGWIRIDTYGGRLTENCVQATARDILRYGVINAEKRGYPIVMRTYDEATGEVPEDCGSVEEFESIMQTMPPWAADWPIRAAGGWRGKRYRKD